MIIGDFVYAPNRSGNMDGFIRDKYHFLNKNKKTMVYVFSKGDAHKLCNSTMEMNFNNAGRGGEMSPDIELSFISETGKILRNEMGCFKKEFTQCYKNETLSATFIISSNIFPLFEGRHFYIRNLEVLGYSPSFWKLNAQNIASTQRIYIDFKNAKVVITPFKGLPVNILKGFIWLITLLSVIIFLAIWYIWGRDKEVIVPTYVSEIPNPKREPWQVFMLTELNDYKIPEILLYQLYNKGALKIEQPKDKKFIISLSKELSISSLSTAEKEAFYLLKKRLEGGYKKQLIKKEKDSYIIDFSGRNLQREKLAGLITNLIEG